MYIYRERERCIDRFVKTEEKKEAEREKQID